MVSSSSTTSRLAMAASLSTVTTEPRYPQQAVPAGSAVSQGWFQSQLTAGPPTREAACAAAVATTVRGSSVSSGAAAGTEASTTPPQTAPHIAATRAATPARSVFDRGDPVSPATTPVS